MQGITILLVGNTDSEHVRALVDEYLKRANRFLPVEVKVLPEVRLSKKDSREKQKQLEGAAILGAIGSQDEAILLDERGKEYSSREFADFLQRKMQTIPRRMLLIVGGPYGFSEEVYRQVPLRLSLSKMTLSHQLVRLFAVEQVYRALTIINHHPYHHE